VGRDVQEKPVDESAYRPVRAKLAPLVATPDGEATLAGDQLSFGVVVENRAAAPADAYVIASLARPGSGALELHLDGPEIHGWASSAGPEVYALMGRVAVSKVAVPAGGRVRFERTLSLKRLEYLGAPAAELRWTFTINERSQRGTLRVTLPRRESLIVAAKLGNLAEVKRMLAAGADVDAKDEQGHTALEHAAWMKRDDVVAVLLDKGAHPATALGGAAAHDNLPLAKLLLARGAKVDVRDTDGELPLHWAMSRNPRDREMLRLLIENGADIHAKGHDGRSSYDRATPDEQAFMKSIAQRK
jgi:hypothetical protein